MDARPSVGGDCAKWTLSSVHGSPHVLGTTWTRLAQVALCDPWSVI
jgi:hypothetical protein